jgi:hypothetical protein
VDQVSAVLREMKEFQARAIYALKSASDVGFRNETFSLRSFQQLSIGLRSGDDLGHFPIICIALPVL